MPKNSNVHAMDATNPIVAQLFPGGLNLCGFQMYLKKTAGRFSYGKYFRRRKDALISRANA